MTTTISALLDDVDDEASFIAFLTALALDWRAQQQGHPEADCVPRASAIDPWEAGTIGGFLETAAAWAEDSKGGHRHYEPASNPWRRCAEILYAGKYYE